MLDGLRADGTWDVSDRQFGEQTGPEIMERAYPLLNEALAGKTLAEHPMEDPGEPLRYGREETSMISKAVEAGRGRLRNFERTVATTEQGKNLQRELGGSQAYIDAVIEQVAVKRPPTVYTRQERQTKLNRRNDVRPRRILLAIDSCARGDSERNFVGPSNRPVETAIEPDSGRTNFPERRIAGAFRSLHRDIDCASTDWQIVLEGANVDLIQSVGIKPTLSSRRESRLLR
jgi:hypothetical protein